MIKDFFWLLLQIVIEFLIQAFSAFRTHKPSLLAHGIVEYNNRPWLDNLWTGRQDFGDYLPKNFSEYLNK